MEEINIKDETNNIKNEEEGNLEKQSLIQEILQLQDEFNSLNKQSEELTTQNNLLKDENEVFSQYIDNLMDRITKINPDILSQFNKNH